MGGGEIPAGNTSKIQVAKSNPVLSNYFFPGWVGVNTGRYQSTALILFYSFSFLFHHLIASHWALYLGKSEITFLWKDQLKTSLPLHFCKGFSCSALFGIWAGNTGSWLGRCLNWAPWSPGTRSTLVGNTQPLSCDTAEEQRGPNQMG